MQAEAAVGMLVCAQPEPAVLLIRRPQHPADPWSGHWALPGGRCMVTDDHLVATCRREVQEEVGIVLEQPPVATWPVRAAGSWVGRRVLVRPFSFHFTAAPMVTPDPREVAAWHWLPLRRLVDPALRQHGPIALAGGRAVPHLPVVDAPLWGFTYALLDACYGPRA